MASEPKNRGPILKALDEVRNTPTLASEALTKRSGQNTRPAPVATDTGLERYERVQFDELDNPSGMIRHRYGEYVRFEQAEDIIAAKNKEIAELRTAIMADDPDPILQHGNFIEMAETLHRACNGGRERAEKAEELLAAEREKADEYYGEAVVSYDRKLRIEDLQAKLAAAEKALEPFAEIAEWDIGDSEADDDIYRPMDGRYATAKLIRVGDLRKAHAVLEGKP